MEANFYPLDWERIGEVLAAIVIMAFLLERALSVLFESNCFVKYMQGKNWKELIAVVVCVGVCLKWNFDALSMIFLQEKTTLLGMVITGAIVAGGSKGSIRLFKEAMGIMSEAEYYRIQAKEKSQGADK
jgi:hypothetical protein